MRHVQAFSPKFSINLSTEEVCYTQLVKKNLEQSLIFRLPFVTGVSYVVKKPQENKLRQMVNKAYLFANPCGLVTFCD